MGWYVVGMLVRFECFEYFERSGYFERSTCSVWSDFDNPAREIEIVVPVGSGLARAADSTLALADLA